LEETNGVEGGKKAYKQYQKLNHINKAISRPNGGLNFWVTTFGKVMRSGF